MWTAFRESSKAAVASKEVLALHSQRNTKREVVSWAVSYMAWDSRMRTMPRSQGKGSWKGTTGSEMIGRWTE